MSQLDPTVSGPTANPTPCVLYIGTFLEIGEKGDNFVYELVDLRRILLLFTFVH